MPITNIITGTPVSNALREYRRNVCKGCLHRHNTLGVRTCGTPQLKWDGSIYGGIVISEGREIELCGCIIKEKTKYEGEFCPAHKW